MNTRNTSQNSAADIVLKQIRLLVVGSLHPKEFSCRRVSIC